MRRLLAFCMSLLLWMQPVAAIDMVVTSGGASNLTILQGSVGSSQMFLAGGGIKPSTSVNSYAYVQGSTTGNYPTTASPGSGYITSPGTLNTLLVIMAAPDNGAGVQSYAITVFKNGSATAITCTISEAAITCTDTVNSVTVVAGDLITLEIAPSGTPANSNQPQFMLRFDANDEGVSQFIGSTGDTTIQYLGGVKHYVPLDGQGTSTTVVFNVAVLMPTAGTLKNLYVQTGDPGTSNGYVWTLEKNSTGDSTALTCTVLAGQTTCSDTTNTVAVAAGELYMLEMTFTGPSSVDYVFTTARWGVTLVATNAGEFVIAASSVAPSRTATNYLIPVTNRDSWNDTETNADQATLPLFLKAIYVAQSGSLGVGKSNTFTIRKNAASTVISCGTSGANTTCNLTDITGSFNPISVASSDLLSTQNVPSGTPTARDTVVSYLAQIAPNVMVVKY